jgi:hypothetical protein
MFEKITVELKESESRAFLDIRVHFANVSFVIDSYTQTQRMEANEALRSFQAAAEDVFVVFEGDDLGKVIKSNENDFPAPLLRGENLYREIERTLKKRAHVSV